MTNFLTELIPTSPLQRSGPGLSDLARKGGQRINNTENVRQASRPLVEQPNMPLTPFRRRVRIRVFVMGPNTALGRAVIAELLARGHYVTVLNAEDEVDFKGVVTLLSDLAQAHVMRAVAGWTDAVIYCDKPEPGTAKPVADALCGMLAALPPHGRLISASGAICPDCPDAAAIDQAILIASNGVPQSGYVLASTLLERGQNRQPNPFHQHAQMLHSAVEKCASRPATMTVEDCARLLACLADNGAFKGGVVGCPTLAASLPTNLVHPVRHDFEGPQSPEEYGYVSVPHRPLNYAEMCPRTHEAAKAQSAEKHGRGKETRAFSGWSTPLGRMQ